MTTRRCLVTVVGAAVALSALVPSTVAPRSGPTDVAGTAASTGKKARAGVPLRFEANQGQSDPAVRFWARGNGHALFLTPTEAVLALDVAPPSGPKDAVNTDVVRTALIGSNPAPQIEGIGRLPGVSNYLVGSDPSRWQRGVPSYAKVTYRGVYPGIDMIYHSGGGDLEYDFVVAPGADPDSIALSMSGVSKLVVNARGDLVASTPGGARLRQMRPKIFQRVGNERRVVPGGFVVRPGQRVEFSVGPYDHSRPLVIDPVVLTSSTYTGGREKINNQGIATDAQGNSYITGYANPPEFPTTAGAYRRSGPGVFVAKFSPDGRAQVYSTYLGEGRATDIAVDGEGAAHVTGVTDSPEFPTTPGAADRSFGPAGHTDAFVTKLRPDGSGLAYSTLLGGELGDSGASIAIGPDGAAHIVGTTRGGFGFLLPEGAYQRVTKPNGEDAFVVKLNSDGSAMAYATYLGGSKVNRPGFDGGSFGWISQAALA